MAQMSTPNAIRSSEMSDQSVTEKGTEAQAVDETQEKSSELTWRSGLALAGSALAYFCTVGFMNAYGVFQQYYTAHYLPTYSNFQISWIGSFANFTLFAVAPLGGMLADRYGPTIPILIGSILQVVAIFMVSLCREYYQFFLAQALLLGIGMSLVAIATSTIVPMHFKKTRGTAQGISIGGSSLGGIIWPLALDQMLNKDGISFGWTMRIIGFIMIPLLALVLVFVRPPPKTKPARVDTIHEQQDESLKPKKDFSALRQPAFIFLCAGLALAFFGFFAPIFYISVYATHLGFSENLAFHLVSILNAASLVGRILPGILADHYLGHFNTLTISMVLSGVVVFCWTQATSVAGLIVWTMAYGFASGAILSLQLACATGLVPDSIRGAAIGAAMGSVSLTGLLGAPIAGKLVEMGYGSLSGFAGAMLMGGVGMVGLSRFAKNRELWVKA
ncbi:unnamed protein product [Zymoseptoria tritici ST99CH_1A5]|uniref:Major facilitator superfamily (MFS) profile domain-containing protein n=1 Tax=Zymoseptoria tritici ST99CH_1A5 TaxID=1276529 RepID=A0A1Y6LL39_ZYMTR|nr:unnamed protein product [Zymoseptoria tritici ST99CH_1A5]